MELLGVIGMPSALFLCVPYNNSAFRRLGVVKLAKFDSRLFLWGAHFSSVKGFSFSFIRSFVWCSILRAIRPSFSHPQNQIAMISNDLFVQFVQKALESTTTQMGNIVWYVRMLKMEGVSFEIFFFSFILYFSLSFSAAFILVFIFILFLSFWCRFCAQFFPLTIPPTHSSPHIRCSVLFLILLT